MAHIDSENNSIINKLPLNDSSMTANGTQQLPPLPEGLEPLGHQLAGHKFGDKANAHFYGMLDRKDGTILKPVMLATKGERERHFYDLVYGKFSDNHYFSSDLYDCSLIKRLQSFIPEYFGIESFTEHPEIVYIRMVDVTAQYSKPHILDVKIGAVPWPPDTPADKVAVRKARCPYIDEMRFQVLGARFYDADTGKRTIKMNLRKLSPQILMEQGLPEVFHAVPSNLRQSLIGQIIHKIVDIESWFREQQLLTFYGSSILIVFEGDRHALERETQDLATSDSLDCVLHKSFITVKMIDFVHVWQTNKRDQNYLDGVSSLRSYLTEFMNHFE